jgi:hypothetical protein
MSSEPRAAVSEVRIRRRLHSLLWRYQARLFALLLVADVARVIYNLLFRASMVPSVASGLLEASAFSLAAYCLWFKPRRWFATNAGIEVRSSGAVRLVPWSAIADWRCVPMTWLEAPWYPRRFEVELADVTCSSSSAGVTRARWCARCAPSRNHTNLASDAQARGRAGVRVRRSIASHAARARS